MLVRGAIHDRERRVGEPAVAVGGKYASAPAGRRVGTSRHAASNSRVISVLRVRGLGFSRLLCRVRQ